MRPKHTRTNKHKHKQTNKHKHSNTNKKGTADGVVANRSNVHIGVVNGPCESSMGPLNRLLTGVTLDTQQEAKHTQVGDVTNRDTCKKANLEEVL